MRDAGEGLPAGCTGTDPAWSPTGEWLAFVRWCEGDSDIDVGRPDGTDIRGWSVSLAGNRIVAAAVGEGVHDPCVP